MKKAIVMSLLFLNLCCSAQRKITIPHADAVNSLMAEYHVPTVGVSIIEKGKLKHVQMVGNLPHHSPAPDNTLFNIASVTKPVTAYTALILVSQGKWQLDEPLSSYWVDPDVANDERHKKLTTRHVLSHQSGLPNWRGHEPGGKLAFAFEPGTQWKYSGEGFEYLRQALEKKFKQPFEQLVDSLVFKPLGMKDSHFFWDASVDSSLYANRHHEDGTPFELETWYSANPSNLLLTTVGDYARFGMGVMGHKGLKADVYNEMTATQVRLQNNREWGLGWSLIKGLSNGEYAMVHTGGNPGIKTIVVLLPQSKRGIVVFTNGEKGDQLYEKLIGDAFDLGKEIMTRMK